jgi:hypothetical protein
MTLSKAQFVKIPRIAPPFTARGEQQHVYSQWLDELLKVRQNKSVFMRSEKQEVDERFRLQARQQFARSSENLKRAVADVSGYFPRDVRTTLQLCQIDRVHSKTSR